ALPTRSRRTVRDFSDGPKAKPRSSTYASGTTDSSVGASQGRSQCVLDDTTIREFLRDDYPRLVNAVALLTGDLPAAEDAVQAALVRAWIRSDRGDVIESLPAWVTVVAMNLTRSGWRRVTAERRARARLASVVADDSRGVDRVD